MLNQEFWVNSIAKIIEAYDYMFRYKMENYLDTQGTHKMDRQTDPMPIYRQSIRQKDIQTDTQTLPYSTDGHGIENTTSIQ